MGLEERVGILNILDKIQLVSSRPVEVLHVVYADAVGYSQLSFAEKTRFDEALSDAVRSFAQIAQAVAKVDNGDGFAIAFRNDPTLALSAAVSIRQFLNLRVPTQVRFGVHCGPAIVRSDLTGAPSLSGHAIEHAQRVMSLCQAGEILVSTPLAAMISAFPEWRDRLGIGRVGKIKDGSVLVVHPLHAEKMRRIVFLGQPDGEDASSWERMVLSLSERLEVLRLPTELILATLGEWQKHEHEIDACLVVGPLGESEDAVLAWLRRSSVQVMSAIELPGVESMTPLCEEQEDVRSALHRVVESLVGPTRHAPSVDGPVPLGSPFYIRRMCDAELEQAIDRRESVILLRSPRRSGKSSLILRGLHYARAQGARTLLIDLGAADRSVLESAEGFYRWIISQIATDGSFAGNSPVWDPDIGPNSNLEIAVRQLLGAGHWFLVFDRVDRLWSFPHRDDFFGLLRSWHNRRAVSGDSRWSGLSVLLSYAGEAEALVSDVNQSPFNVGRRIDLPVLTRGEVSKLCQIAHHPHSDRVFELTSGQPALVQSLISLGLGPESAPEIVEILATSPGFSSLKIKLQSDETLAKVCAELLAEGRSTHSRMAHRLMSLGVFTPSSNGVFIPSSPLMASFLRSVLGGFSGRLR